MDAESRAIFLEGLRAAASELPWEVLDGLCARIEQLRADATADERCGVVAGLQGAHARSVAIDLVRRWNTEETSLGPQAFAWALRSAATMDAWHRARQRIELVWTGPTPEGSPLRRIDQGLLEVIQRAKRSLVIVTFAAWEAQRLRAALVDALDRGVRMMFIIETREDSGGRMWGDAGAAIGGEILRPATCRGVCVADGGATDR